MDINTVLMMISDKIPSNSLPLVQDKLKNASEDKINSLAILPFKSHIIGLILGLFLGAFGIDRFYKGDIGLGIAKLITWLVGVVTIWIYIGGLILFVLWIWCIVDWFLVWKGIKKDNLNKGKSLFRETDSIYLNFASLMNSAMDITCYDKDCYEILIPICRFICHQVAEMTGDDLYRLVQWLGKRDYMITQEDLSKKARDKSLTMEEISLISHYMDINETGGE